jgi:hypothetical protein
MVSGGPERLSELDGTQGSGIFILKIKLNFACQLCNYAQYNLYKYMTDWHYYCPCAALVHTQYKHYLWSLAFQHKKTLVNKHLFLSPLS